MKYLIGIDLGTSGTKTALFAETGELVASATEEYPLYQPRNGWAEQDPEDWFSACVKTLRQVLEASGIDSGDIAGIGLSGQMHGLVLLDEKGESLRNSIIWCDGRTGEQCAKITERVGKARLIEISANPALTGFTAGKILWVRENEPEIYARARHILLPKDYLRYKLCGVFATEVSDASGMNLLDVPKRRWSEEILRELSIEPDFLPEMYESVQVSGHVTQEAAALTGLKTGTPVVGGAGDNAAASIGTGVVEAGKSFVTIGTSGVIFAHSDEVQIDPQGRVHTFCAAVPGAWTVMSCTLAAGGSLQWFRNNFCAQEMQEAASLGVDPYTLMARDAEKAPVGSNRLVFLPYLMGERSPILNPEARGVFFGLSGVHGKAEMIRAVMEGVAYSQRDCLEVFRQMRVPVNALTITGGGGRSPLWRQIIADALGLPVSVCENAEGPALGAAILAGVGTGVYSDIPSACKALIRMGGLQQPDSHASERYDKYYELYTSVYGSLKEQFAVLASL